MTNQELLISRITQLSEDEISSVLNAVTLMLEAKELTPNPDCPYCGSPAIIRYGHKCNKQRFRCKSCERTFVTTTNTIMANSHYQVSVWKEMITDTLYGNAIDYSAKRLGLYHQAAFDMRHKILLALQELPETADACLGEVSEFDETFVLDCYKGRKLEGTVNRAKPSAKELISIFEGDIADGTLALCDGLRSYHAFPGIAGCTVKDCNNRNREDSCFYNLNTVNRFHSFIKQRYEFYRGVASKYINRYNALFSAAYRKA